MTTKCLIIAAGRGQRMAVEGPSKPLVPVLGIPLIEWVVRSAVNAGLNDLYVVIGYQGDRIRLFLEILAEKYGVSITPVINQQWHKENGLSVLKARSVLKGDFILLMADHLVDYRLLELIKAQDVENDGIVLAVDHRLDNPLVDLDDVTKVYTDGGKVIRIGKDLEHFNGFDTGVFLCSAGIFKGLTKSICNHKDSTLSGGVRYLIKRKQVTALDIGQRFWVDVDDAVMIEKATEFLSFFQKKSILN